MKYSEDLKNSKLGKVRACSMKKYQQGRSGGGLDFEYEPDQTSKL